ncbi:MAG: hypothetical protein AB8F74_13830 [Saprospiraceae bacterium]
MQKLLVLFMLALSVFAHQGQQQEVENGKTQKNVTELISKVEDILQDLKSIEHPKNKSNNSNSNSTEMKISMNQTETKNNDTVKKAELDQTQVESLHSIVMGKYLSALFGIVIVFGIIYAFYFNNNKSAEYRSLP